MKIIQLPGGEGGGGYPWLLCSQTFLVVIVVVAEALYLLFYRYSVNNDFFNMAID